MIKPITAIRVGILINLMTITIAASAQFGINQGFGLGYTRSDIRITAMATRGSAFMKSDIAVRAHTTNLVYLIRRDIFRANGISFSVGLPLTAGVGWTSRYRSTDFDGTTTYQYGDSIKGTSWAFDIPVVADLNIGLHSASDDSREHSFGVYVGAGYAYSYMKLRTSIGKLKHDGYEPLLRAGLRWGHSWERRWCLALSLRGNWTTGANKTYGLQLLKEL